MSEARDPAIKLFGRTIPLPESRSVENSDRSTMDEAGEEVKVRVAALLLFEVVRPSLAERGSSSGRMPVSLAENFHSLVSR